MYTRGFLRMAISQATILRRNVTFWLVSIFIAALSMLVFGALFSPDQQPMRLAVVDEDGSPAAAELVAAFESVDSVELNLGPRDAELAALHDGDREALVVIPAGFETSLAMGGSDLEVLYDNSNPTELAYATTTLKAVVDGYNEQVNPMRDPVRMRSEAVDTNSGSYIDFLTPGMVGMTIMFTNLAVGLMMVNWREQGILRRLGVTPLRPGAFIGSQAVSFAAVSIAQVAIILALGRLAFGVEVQGSVVWLALTAVLGVLCMLSIGYVIASFARTVTSFNVVQQLVAFPMLFLGGSYFPVDPSPILAPVVNAVPLTHLNDALREVINRGGGPADLWVSWLVLLAWAGCGFLVSLRLFRWQ